MRIFPGIRGRRRKETTELPRSGRGVLVLVAGFLMASAALRAVETFGIAQARDEQPPATVAPGLQEAAPSPVSQAQLDVLLRDLLEREAAVTERERAVELRIATSVLAEERVNRAVEDLRAAERRLRDTMAMADEAAENDLMQLTSVYENMKPQQAAPLFAQMSPQFAAGFLGRMRPDAAAAIMAGLDPTTAYAISVILAGRNANVPRSSQSD